MDIQEKTLSFGLNIAAVDISTKSELPVMLKFHVFVEGGC
jgi:hypothetical protein